MDVGQSAVRQRIHERLIPFYPTLIQQVALRPSGNRLYRHVKRLALGRLDGKARLDARLAFQQRIVVFAGLDGLTVDMRNHVARLDFRRYDGKRPVEQHFLYFQTVALERRIEENAQFRRVHAAAVAIETATRMRGVEFAQQFARHFREVVAVVDMRQKARVVVVKRLPVHAAERRIVELVKHLTPDMVEPISAFLGRKSRMFGREIHRFHLAAGRRDFLNAVASQHEEGRTLFGGQERAVAHVTHFDFGFTFPQILDPQGELVLIGRNVVEFFAVLIEEHIHDVIHRREPHRAFVEIIPVERQRFHLVFLIGRAVGLFFVLLALFRFFLLVGQGHAFLIHLETFVGLAVEEHQIDIVFAAPRPMAAVAVTVADEHHGLAAQRPLTVALAVTAVRQVVDFAGTVGLDHRQILMVPTARADIARQNPAAVGAPAKRLVAIGIRILVFAVHGRMHLARFQVQHADFGAVTQKSQRLAVGAVFGIETRGLRLGQGFFLEFGRIGKAVFILGDNRRLINLPQAVALGRIGDGTAIGRKIDVTLIFGRVRYPLRRFVFDRGHIDIAFQHKRDFVAIRRNGDFGGAAAQNRLDQFLFGGVVHNLHRQFDRLRALAHRINLAVVGKAQQAVGRNAQKTYRMRLKVGQFPRLRTRHGFPLIDVETAVLFAQIIIVFVVGRPYRVAVFALEVGQSRIYAIVEQPDVARYRRGVMLAPRVFVALAVVVEDTAVGREADVKHRLRLKQLGTAAVNRYLIELRIGALRHLTVRSGRHDSRAEDNRVVGQERIGNLHPAPRRDPLGRAALYRHHINVTAPLAVAHKRDTAAVRTPYRPRVVGAVGGQLTRRTAFHRHHIEVALVTESNLFAVRRYGRIAEPQRRGGRLLGLERKRAAQERANR